MNARRKDLSSAIEIRRLTKIRDFSDVVRLQREIWGFDDIELLPLRLFVVADKIGGHILGALDSGTMIGFCLAIPGLKPGGKSYLHSHMMGVLPDYRNTGIGRRLKMKQCEYALEIGVDLIEWTFDPLEIKNAFFNIERLGAVVRRYVHNQYGTTSSHLHGGLPTDRLVAEWWIRSPRVEAIIHERSFSAPAFQARISVPSEIAHLRKTDRERAREIQARVAKEFGECFRGGLAVLGFERSKEAGTYLLGRWESQ